MDSRLRPHQLSAMKRLSNGSILYGGVGTGKSRVALAYYMEHEGSRDVVVITTAKVRDSLHWEAEAAGFGVGKEKDATVRGVLTVDSWNNIAKYTDREDCFFIFDEQRLVGKGKWVKSFLKIAKRNRWILLSATPGDNWLDYIPVFIANGFYKNRTQFIAEHVIQAPYVKFFKVAGYTNVGKLVRYRNQILVKMKYETEAEKRTVVHFVDYDKEMFERVVKERWNDEKNRPIQNAAELFSCMRSVVNSDPSRLRAVQSLLSLHDRLVVFYNFDYELKALRGLSESVTVAEWNGHKHEELPDTEKWVYLVQYQAGSEGWNCTETNAICFYSLTYSYKNWHQAHGRIDRLNTEFAKLFYYVLRSKSPIDAAVWRALMNKQDFQESEILANEWA